MDGSKKKKKKSREKKEENFTPALTPPYISLHSSHSTHYILMYSISLSILAQSWVVIARAVSPLFRLLLIYCPSSSLALAATRPTLGKIRKTGRLIPRPSNLWP
jgi:hypothetical protein